MRCKATSCARATGTRATTSCGPPREGRGGRVDRYFAEPASGPRQGPEAQPVNAGRETALTTEQRAGCFVAAALAARNDEVTRASTAAFTPALSPEGRIAAQAAASIMAMNNVHCRFT